MIVLDLSILNQKGTPMFYSDIFANRPTFGIVGRIFISTDTKEFYRDTGTSWELLGGPGAGTITGSGTIGKIPLWSGTTSLGDSDLTQFSSKGITLNNPSGLFPTTQIANDAGRILLYSSTNNPMLICWGNSAYGSGEEQGSISLGNVTNLGATTFGGAILDGYIENAIDGSGALRIRITNNLGNAQIATIIDSFKNSTFYGYVAATPTLTAANNASSLASYGINTLSYASGFSSNNIGALYGGIAGFNLQTFAGSATFANANIASGGASINSIDFSSAGSTITMTQSSGLRVMSGQQNLFQYQGTNSGTITHAAISQNTGFYRPSGATGTLTITNAYSHLINALDDYGAGFTFTNRWGIYQAGSSDTNYFAASCLIGTTVNTGEKFIVNGTGRFSGSLSVNSILRSTIGDIRSVGSGSDSFADGSFLTLVNSSNNYQYLLQLNSTYGLDFWTFNSTGVNKRMTLNPIGNLGLGIVPNSSWADYNVIQFGQQGILSSSAGAGVLNNGTNFYWDGSGYKYLTSDTATQYQQAGGGHSWRIAASGTAGNAITFTQAMTLNSSGNLSIGSTSDPGQKLYLNGSMRIDGQTSGSSGGSSGQHLIINCDGTTYKIALLNP